MPRTGNKEKGTSFWSEVPRTKERARDKSDPVPKKERLTDSNLSTRIIAPRGAVALADAGTVHVIHLQTLLVPLGFILGLTIVSLQCLPFAFDDAYIHFRIAENFARHGAPYFNTAEAVMATSSPVWTCVLALFALTSFSLPTLTAFINAVFTGLGSLVWSALLEQIVTTKMSRATVWLMRLGYVGILLPSSVGLMETPLAMLLFGWGALLLLRSNPRAWSVIALAVFTRYELVIFAALAAVMHVTTTRKYTFRSALLFLLPAVVVGSFLLFFFASPIPHTITAKRVVYSLSRPQVLTQVFYNLIPKLDHPVFGLPMAWPIEKLISSALALIGMTGMFVLAGIVCCTLPFSAMLSDQRERWSVCIGATGALIGLAYVVQHVFLHEWYTPLFACPILFFACVVSRRNALAWTAAVTLSLLPLATIVEYSLAAMGQPSILRAAIPGARVQRYMEVGRLLYTLFPEARLMASEIGGLGISFQGTILDGVGLITPTALPYHPIPGAESGIGGIPSGFIREMKPELIVSYPVFLRDTENTDATQDYVQLSIPAFSNRYRKLLGAKSLWGCETLRIYIRHDHADSVRVGILKKKLRATVDTPAGRT